MNIDNMHDALNLLDDDLIEGVARLRNEKMQTMQKQRNKMWMSMVSVAACICIVAVSMYATDGFGLMVRKGGVMGGEQSAGTAFEQEGELTGNEDGTEELKGATESPSVLVEIISWGENGFTGTVTGIVDTEKYPVGTTVSIQFHEDICIEVSGGDKTTSQNDIPDSEDFSVGSVVRVQFDKSDLEANEVILYAETITRSETE